MANKKQAMTLRNVFKCPKNFKEKTVLFIPTKKRIIEIKEDLYTATNKELPFEIDSIQRSGNNRTDP
jgi:hypothetical protein